MKKFLLAVAMVALVSDRASATIVIQDGFDSYTGGTAASNQAAFEAVWPRLTTNSGQIATSSPAPVTAPNSISFDTTGTQRNQRIFAETGLPSATNTIRFSFDFYDSNAALAPYRQQHNIQDTTAPGSSLQLVSMGLSNNLSSTAEGGNYYMARVLGANPNGGTAGAYFKLNNAGAPLRSTGWHNLRVDITNLTLTFYVDGILSETLSTTGLTLRSYDNVRIGSGLSSTATSNIDNILVETFNPQAIPEAGAFVAMGLVGVLSAGTVSIRKRRAVHVAA